MDGLRGGQIENSTPPQLTSAQWSLFHPCQLENEEMEVLCNSFAQFTNVWSIHRSFYKLKTMDDDQKSLFRNWQLIPNIFIANLPIFVQCKTKVAVGAVCALLPKCQLLYKMAL
jgi:hypothetical protein